MPETIVVTGCTRGTGRALTEELVARGHRVLGCGRSEDAIAELREAHPDHAFEALDITDRGAVAAWAEAMTFTPNLDDRAALLQLLGNGTRMRMFFVLDRLEAVCVCDLAEILGVTQSAVSQHLAKFRAHRLVTSRRDGQTLFYSLAESADVDLLRRLGIADIETPPYG